MCLNSTCSVCMECNTPNSRHNTIKIYFKVGTWWRTGIQKAVSLLNNGRGVLSLTHYKFTFFFPPSSIDNAH